MMMYHHSDDLSNKKSTMLTFVLPASLNSLGERTKRFERKVPGKSSEFIGIRQHENWALMKLGQDKSKVMVKYNKS
jgi:hypothetical protein